MVNGSLSDFRHEKQLKKELHHMWSALGNMSAFTHFWSLMFFFLSSSIQLESQGCLGFFYLLVKFMNHHMYDTENHCSGWVTHTIQRCLWWQFEYDHYGVGPFCLLKIKNMLFHWLSIMSLYTGTKPYFLVKSIEKLADISTNILHILLSESLLVYIFNIYKKTQYQSLV